MARIYPNHMADYMEVFDDIPEGVAKAIQDAPVCKRMLDPAACNSRCPMGYDFVLKGQRLQNAMQQRLPVFTQRRKQGIHKKTLAAE